MCPTKKLGKSMIRLTVSRNGTAEADQIKAADAGQAVPVPLKLSSFDLATSIGRIGYLSALKAARKT